MCLRKTPFFRRKLAKIAENCGHNIDPLEKDEIIAVHVLTSRAE
jgi:hypothetical protein